MKKFLILVFVFSLFGTIPSFADEPPGRPPLVCYIIYRLGNYAQRSYNNNVPILHLMFDVDKRLMKFKHAKAAHYVFTPEQIDGFNRMIAVIYVNGDKDHTKIDPDVTGKLWFNLCTERIVKRAPQ